MAPSFRRARTLIYAAVLAIPLASLAAPADSTPGIYIDLGRGDSETDSLTLGYVMPWSWRGSPAPGTPLSFYWDFFLSQWRAPLPPRGADRGGYTQLGVIANWRWRFSQGESPWFVEAGLGGTVMDRLYRTPEHEFSTAFQFTEQLGVGLNFGAQGAHELSLRVQHFSNAGLKEPNPGVNFVRVRYLYRY